MEKQITFQFYQKSVGERIKEEVLSEFQRIPGEDYFEYIEYINYEIAFRIKEYYTSRNERIYSDENLSEKEEEETKKLLTRDCVI